MRISYNNIPHKYNGDSQRLQSIDIDPDKSYDILDEANVVFFLGASYQQALISTHGRKEKRL
jgi:hypothetical protein